MREGEYDGQNKDAEGKPRKVRIVDLSPDRQGLVGRIVGTEAVFHIHQNEMTRYQWKVYRKFLGLEEYGGLH